MGVWMMPKNRSTVTALMLHNDRKPSGPPNRPYPEDLRPPKGRLWLDDAEVSAQLSVILQNWSDRS